MYQLLIEMGLNLSTKSSTLVPLMLYKTYHISDQLSPKFHGIATWNKMLTY
jgi:hypothetical protein